MANHTVNIWLGLRTTAQNAIMERLNWDEEAQGPYVGPVSDRDAKVFRYMSDQANKQRLFKTATISGADYKLWSLDFDQNLPLVKQELDRLTAENPTQMRVVGAWWWNDGRQVGTQLVWDTRIVTKTWSILNPDYQPDDQEPDYDPRFVLRVTGDVEEEYVTGSTGTPAYPLLAKAQFLKFMPDVGDPPQLATELANVNLGQGQSPRLFI